MTVDPEKLPPAAMPLLPMVERWAIGDDVERCMALEDASDAELEELVTAYCRTGDGFEDWLVSPEHVRPDPSDEFIAMSILVQAYEYARVTLLQRNARVQ